MPPPLFSTSGGGSGPGGGMHELARVLILRGGLPIPWVAVLNFPLPFPKQVRTSLGHRREPPPIAPPIASAAAPPSRFVSLYGFTISIFIISRPRSACSKR